MMSLKYDNFRFHWTVDCLLIILFQEMDQFLDTWCRERCVFAAGLHNLQAGKYLKNIYSFFFSSHLGLFCSALDPDPDPVRYNLAKYQQNLQKKKLNSVAKDIFFLIGPFQPIRRYGLFMWGC